MTLLDRHSVHGAPALDAATIAARLAELPDWQAAGSSIARDYRFADYRATIAFVNAIAAMAESENHHPDMLVGYRHCTLTYTTHSAGNALSDNDFICAAKADALYAQGTGA
ncbi:4a-hydroxytetrahydrobiopterin dehydratase [Massilia yuzhufengensis]|uniref:Putative pterin-4-alpha-carbinolamine dehydratase n=1 Tax=Massilia yuzhufengensis TaxID=1164594 RepID=A0A1I1K309_9BURK|nr:4a-hydroxytetrahydrobiopterin dehydratase [Massilia yuzhufengensis]SFC55234.1 4a-hydroxytetrahydrobiopterin dehydratase [Massilia yuzhufengensis]